MTIRLLSGGGGSRRGFGSALAAILSFLGLTDTPKSYATKAGNIVVVNPGETGLEFDPGRGQANGIASLDNTGHVPNSQLNLDVGIYLGTVANQAAMLALTGNPADWCIRSDVSMVFVATASPLTLLANWVQMAYPPTSTHAFGGALHSSDTVANTQTKLSDGSFFTTMPGEIDALTAKAVPTTADKLVIEDAAAANAKKKITIGNLPAAAPAAHAFAGALHSNDTITNVNTKLTDGSLITTKAGEIDALTVKAVPTTSDELIIEDAAAAMAKKKITIGTMPYQLRVAKVPIAYTDLTAGALSNSITLWSVPAGCMIIGTRLKVGTLFSGGAISAYYLSIGVAAATQDLMGEYESHGITVADDEYAEAQAFQSFNYNSAANILITGRSVGANLSAATQGACLVEVFYIPKA